MSSDGERAMGPPMGSGVVATGPDHSTITNYTIPGILHFIKHEWSRFEKERSNWEVERAELQVRDTIHCFLSCTCRQPAFHWY